ncbi:MAG TPA: nucleotidyltransferase [Tepidisphaeraceae bacterium]|jgi:predicted nucleotidyltransferase|nr:nucleotidyltransferase [Tepidisphaeraceae bacterium]
MGKVNLDRDFRELLESLNSAGVKYLVLGGYAVIFYGYRRTTDDLDIWISIDPENAERVAATLRAFGGFPAGQLKPSMFRTKGKVFIFGREPTRVDILTTPNGIDFQGCYERRRVVNWDGVKVPLISLEDLRENKKASGRAKDLADLENLPKELPRSKSTRRRKRRGT